MSGERRSTRIKEKIEGSSQAQQTSAPSKLSPMSPTTAPTNEGPLTSKADVPGNQRGKETLGDQEPTKRVEATTPGGGSTPGALITGVQGLALSGPGSQSQYQASSTTALVQASAQNFDETMKLLLGKGVIPPPKVKELITEEFLRWKFADVAISDFFDSEPSEFHPLRDGTKYDNMTLLELLLLRCPTLIAILCAAERERTLAGFIDNAATDRSLPITESQLIDRYYLTPGRATDVSEQQNRFVFKELGNGMHVDFGPKENPPYQILRTLGKGSDSIVSSARSLIDPTEMVAIKRSFLYLGSKGNLDPAFLNEVDLMKRLKHPHLVKCVATYTHGNSVFTVISPLGEVNLRTAMKSHRNYFSQFDRESRRPEIILNWMNCLASAIKWLHKRKIIHQDIKPENIILRGEDIFISDWGMARIFGSGKSGIPVQSAWGTPEYSAPESHDIGSETGRAVDIFPLGCIYLELVNTLLEGSFKLFRNKRQIKDPIMRGIEGHSFRRHIAACLVYFEEMKAETEFPAHALEVLQLATQMVSTDPADRPSAEYVAATLKAILRSHLDNIHCGSPRETTPTDGKEEEIRSHNDEEDSGDESS